MTINISQDFWFLVFFLVLFFVVFVSVNIYWRACAMAFVFSLFLFHSLTLHVECVCVYFNVIPLNCLPRSSAATRISNLFVCARHAERSILHNARIRVHIVHMYTHKSTFHTSHLSFFFSFYLSACLPAIVVLFSLAFR